jgi:pimeloyl-ACP methyl ester carboxylesterase
MRSRPAAERCALAALAVLAAACTVEIGERQLLFPWPSRLPPFSEQIDRRNVEIAAGDGVTLRGWLLDVPDERFTLVFFYGNGQSVVGSSVELHTLAHLLRADVVCVDYRGYGFSNGTPTFERLAADALLVFDHALARAGGKRVVLMGYSLGTGPAVLVASRRDAGALVLVAPPASPRSVVAHFESRLPWYARLFFDLEPAAPLRRLDPVPETAIRRVREPVLVVHGTEDAVVPFADGERMFRLAPGRGKRFCRIEGEDHAMALFAVTAYRECVVDFLALVR